MVPPFCQRSNGNEETFDGKRTALVGNERAAIEPTANKAEITLRTITGWDRYAERFSYNGQTKMFSSGPWKTTQSKEAAN
jgi:hypothetical protein